MKEPSQRKIIHVDMDCFYAAVEIRDNPTLANKPVAVGGPSNQRSVLCTCNYIARQYGVRSAMPTSTAYQLCPDLIVLPVQMQKYREVARRIHEIFYEYTTQVEPLSLDEAYLDVSNSPHCQGSATWIANEIRSRIWETVKITASAGVAPNKLLAKIASGWNKPNGLFVIHPHEITVFMSSLPVQNLHGVGKVTGKKLAAQNIKTCLDLQKMSLFQLTQVFGKLGNQLYAQCRGIDERSVEPNRIRKSLSVERTFIKDLQTVEECVQVLEELYTTLIHRIEEYAANRLIKNQYIKIKYNNFKQTTIERSSSTPILNQYKNLLLEIYHNKKLPIRLLGIGVHFTEDTSQTLDILSKI